MSTGEMGKASNQSSRRVAGGGEQRGPQGQRELRPRETEECGSAAETEDHRGDLGARVWPQDNEEVCLLGEKGRVEKAFVWTGQRRVQQSRIKAT